MPKNLLIVESPAKAKTLKKYLGKNFDILASYGHVRDLLPKQGAVDPQHQFAMNYRIIERNQKHIDAIINATKKASQLYLATDPDREGEAIAWHICELLKDADVIQAKPVHRVQFTEITKSAIQAAIEHPRELSLDLIDAQQARRALDYLFGFNASPLLWKKIRRGLSAGRVQSPALRMIVEREMEIEAFVPREYWTITAENQVDGATFSARLAEYKGEKIEQFSVTNEQQAQSIEHDLTQQAQGKLLVTKVDKKKRKRNPAAPFITSTLQQEASRKLGFTAQRTMRIAQQLYEGIDIGDGAVGLITYMRTDSVNLANEAIDEIRQLIVERYGKENLPDEPRVYKTKAKNAQEAHEAIRPTSVYRLPDDIKSALTPEQFKLYNLIWKRAVACQMIHATLNTVAIDLQCGDNPGNRFRANGSTIAHSGFMAVYQEGTDDTPAADSNDEKLLPPMEKGQLVDLLAIKPAQHFTEPPPRYSEASLVKALEEYGIGRPSTYATIISTLQNREYVVLEQKRFYPTDVGRVVNKFLTQHLTPYVDYDFTAKLEEQLDSVSCGDLGWIPLLEKFWQPFKKLVDDIEVNVSRKDVTQEKIDENCPQCGKELTLRLGRRGRFVGCSGYPDCNYTRNVDGEQESTNEAEIITDRKCPECQSDLQIRYGRYGKFIGCTAYPKCKHIEPLEKPKDTGVTCPECHKGKMLTRKSRYGKLFYSCEHYPECKYAVWNTPLAESCPTCQWPILTIKTTKRRGTEKVCPQKECNFAEPYESEDEV
ncbi:MAG: type I DNA topoisomerase [Gammaproteobacteria bacterium]